MRASRVNPTCVDRSSLWRSGLSGAPLHFVTRCTASGTHDTDRSIRHSCLTTSNNTHSLVAARFCVNALSPQQALAGPIPVFSCFSADSDLLKQPISFPRRVFCARVLHLCFAHPNRGVGGAPRDVPVRARHPLGLLMTQQARRLRGALRPIARQDARERAYDAGRSPLGAPPWRFWAPGAALPSPSAPAVLQRRAGVFGSAERTPRTQVVVPGGRGPCLPRRTVTSRRRRTPRLAPHSGSSLEHSMSEAANLIVHLQIVVKN
jgi:hypothetical protein